MSAFLPNTPRFRPALIALDAGCLVAAAWLAHWLRFLPEMRGAKLMAILSQPLFLLVGVGSMWALSAAAELYEPVVLRHRGELVARVAATALGWGVAVVIATYMVPAWQFGRGLMALTAAGWGVLAIASRAVVRRWLVRRPRAGALVVGEPDAVCETCDRLAAHALALWSPINGSRLDTGEMVAAARHMGAELVVVVGPVDSGSIDNLAALHFSGVPVVAASELWAWLDGRLPVAELTPAVFLQQPGFGAVHGKLFNRLTRVLDIGLAGLLLLLALPILVLAGLAILLSDGSPVLYRQVRVGQFGRPFTLLKLRTMRRDAETEGPAFAQPRDPRATRVGRVLRRLRIDELPQLVNVLAGQMSLVGPRPERPEFVAELSEQIPFYTFRLAVPPGLTGWAQVNMPYARTVGEHRLRLEYDLYFIRERSVGLYLLTLLRTGSASLAGIRR